MDTSIHSQDPPDDLYTIDVLQMDFQAMDTTLEEPTAQPSNTDDVWYDDDDDFDSQGVPQRAPQNPTLTAIHRKHEKEGYLDGITKGKETSLQDGFDIGYPHGSEAGMLAGRLVGSIHALCMLFGDNTEISTTDSDTLKKSSLNGTITLSQIRDLIVEDMHVEKLFNHLYYDDNVQLLNRLEAGAEVKSDPGSFSDHPVYVKWERELLRLQEVLFVSSRHE